MLEPLVQHIGRRLTLKQASNGTFIIGGGWSSRAEERPARYSTIWQSAAGNAAVAVRVMPSLADVRLVRMWTGVWASTSDLQPVLGESAAVPGYFMCLAPTGFTLGPLIARMLAAQRSPGGEPLPAEYAPDRKGAAWIETTSPGAATGPRVRPRSRADESYDAESHRELLEWYIDQGLHGVLINGTTGEWFSQSTDERMQVAENAIEAVGGRMTVVIGCTAYTAREASRACEARGRRRAPTASSRPRRRT